MRVSELILAVCASVCVLQATYGHGGELCFHCRDGWTLYGGVCYMAFNIPMEYNDAKDTCERQGGKVIQPVFEGVLHYLKDEMQGFPETFWTGYYQPSGETLQNLRMWSDYQPSTNPDDCFVINNHLEYAGQSCGLRDNFVCEYDACLEGFVPCALGSKCVNESSALCNGVWDCDDRSDERDCSNACKVYTRIPAGTTSGGFITNTIVDGKDCWWTLEAPVGMLIRLFIPDMNIETTVAYLHILTGSPSVKDSRSIEFITCAISSHNVYSDNNFLHIRLYAGDLTADINSITFTWTTVSDMRAEENILEATNAYQTIQFPYSSEKFRPQGLKVYWTITAPEGEVISFHVESASGLYIRSPFSFIGRDGTVLTNNYRVRGTNELVVFAEDTDDIEQFTFYYITGCHITIGTLGGVVFSPDYELSRIPHEVSCEWIFNYGITLDPPRGMTVNLTSSLEGDPRNGNVDIATMDTLQIFGDNDSIPLTALLNTNLYVAPGGQLRVKFDADTTVHSARFDIEYGVDCEPLVLSEDTIKSNEDSFFLHPVRLSCPLGYQFNLEKYKNSAGETTECYVDGFKMDDGTNVVPECQVVQCGTPPKINNGYIINATSTSYQGNAWYGCDQGFALTGDSMVTCSAQGTWDTPPTCTSSSCSDANGILDVADGGYEVEAGNPIAEGSAEFNVVVRFFCDAGFELIGQQRTHCTADGWTHESPPTCRRLNCVLPKVDENARPFTEATLEYGSSISTLCDPGYLPIGAQSLECLANQTLDGEITCTNINECDSPNNCDEDTETCMDTDGDFICLCIDGYEKSNPNDACLDIRECDVDNGGCSDTCNELFGSYDCQCPDGYDLFTENGLHGHVIPPSETGLLPGDTYRYNHTCVRKACQTLPEVPNGKYSSYDLTLLHDDTIGLVCEDGYEFSASFNGVYTCSDGSISPSPRQCSARSCTIPSPPTYGSYNKDSVMFKETIELNCRYDSIRNITRTATCIYADGAMKFGGENINDCPKVDCGTPMLPQGGVIEGGQQPASTLYLEEPSFVFACGTGYERAGGSGDTETTSVVCKSNGRWDFGTLNCIGKRCEDPGTPVDAVQIVTSYESGQTLRYECTETGFKPLLLGQERNYTCEFDSSSNTAVWSNGLTNSLPTCTDVTSPTQKTCPDNQVYFPMDTVQVTVPTFEDNFGVSVEDRTNYMATGDVILEEQQFSYTVADFASNTESCDFTFSILDRNSKPQLTCPDSEIVSVMSEDDGTMDVEDFLTYDTTDDSLSLNVSPSTIQKTLSNIGSSQIVTATLTDGYGRATECTFMVHFTAGKCFQESLYPDTNSVRSCATTATGLSCNSTCNNNYVLSDGTGMKTFECTDSNQDWNFPSDLDIFCLPIENPASQSDVTVTYAYDGFPTRDCVTDFSALVNNNLASIETNIRTQVSECSGMNWDVTIQTQADSDSIYLLVIGLRMNLVSTEFSSDEKETCVNAVDASATTVFALNNNRLTCASVSRVLVVDSAVTSTPQLTCSEMLSQKTTEDGRAVCVPCGPGYLYDSDSVSCERCPSDQYQNLMNQVECSSCPTATAPDPLQIDCDRTCPPGFTSTDGFYPCTPCPVNEYWVDSKNCTPCSGSSTTVGLQGADSADKCYDPCPIGCYSDTGYNYVNNVACHHCPVGFYQPNVGQQACLECPATETTNGSQATSLSDCIALTTCNDFGCDMDGTLDCEYTFHRPVCKCKDGFTGEKCNHKNEICDYGPCTSGSKCTPVSGGSNSDFTCTCRTDLDVCTMNNVAENREVQGQDYYEFLPGVDNDTCSETCRNDATCQSAVHSINGNNQLCLLYNTTRTDLQSLGSGDSSVYMEKNCVVAFGGDRCETDQVNDCATSDCSEDSMCMDNVGDFECLCPVGGGFSGPRCDQAVAVCSSNTCQNGGTCTPHGTVRFECTCAVGFTGVTCETQIDACTDNPGVCLYGGTCNTLVDGYECDCDGDFDGDNCQNVPDFCSTSNYCLGNPCLSRTDMRNGTCECKGPLFGQGDSDSSCTQIQEPCDVLVCGNDGTCVENNDGLTALCACVPGWTGSMCQHNIDDCTETSCQNGGTCNDLVDSFNCTCVLGFDGEICGNNVDDCVSNDCENGECVDGVNSYSCACTPGYTGDMCQTDINDCASLPCRHNGMCTDEVNAYSCECPAGWTGDDCELAVSKCEGADNKCQNDGQCFTIVETSICRCQGGTQGEVCEEPRDVCDVLSDADLCQNDGICQNSEGSAVCACKVEHSVDRCYFMDALEDTYGGEEYKETSTGTSADDCKNQCLQSVDCDGVSFSATLCFFYDRADISAQNLTGTVHYNRVCPTDYSGNSCECIKDWCSDNTLCQNGGTCRPTAPKGYMCDCQDGYSGVHCETAPDPCLSSPCGSEAISGANCISTVSRFYCQCPWGSVFNGTVCKVPETEFNLLIDNMNGNFETGLNAPFRLESNSVSVMLRVKVYAHQDQAMLFELISSPTASSEDWSFRMGLSSDGYAIKAFFRTKSDQFDLPIEYDVFDGEFHHVAIALDENGELTSTVDARTVDTPTDTGPGFEFNHNVWLNVGESVIAEYKDITVWKEYLERTVIVQAFVGILPQDLSPVQGWWNYKLPRSTAILTSDRAMSPVLDITMMPPTMNCAGASTVTHVLTDRFVSREGITALENNLRMIEQNNPDLDFKDSIPSELSWGWREGIVAGMNEYGYDECRFPVYVKYNDECPEPVKLSDDVQYIACSNADGICSVSCTDNAEGLSAPLPRYMPCSELGVYDIRAPHKDLFLPACNPKAPTKYVTTARMQFEFAINCVNLGPELSGQVDEFIRETFIGLNTSKWPGICNGATCTNLQIHKANCSSNGDTTKRFDLEFELQLDDETLSYINGGTVGGEDVMRMIVKLEQDISLENYGSGVLLPDTVDITWTEKCTTPGYVLILENNAQDKVCVPCGPGYYFYAESGQETMCVPCPKGQYQDELAQPSCKECGNDTNTGNPRTTNQMYAKSVDQCVEVCPVGQYYDKTNSGCMDCARHYYQNETGQDFCKPCPIGFKTARLGSNSSSECKEDCPAGQYIEAGTLLCRNCSRGYWRSLELDDCQLCPTSNNDANIRTTTMIGELGVSQASCRMDNCTAGTYWSPTDSQCLDCYVGLYQPDYAMLKCEQCPKNYTTRASGSMSEDNCTFICAAGYEVNPNVVDSCLPCPRGEYKDNVQETKFDDCIACPSDFTTNNIGTISSSDCELPVCDRGQVITEDLDDELQCENCPADTYSEVDLPYTYTTCVSCMDECDECGFLFGTNKTGASESTDCMPYCKEGEELIEETCMPCQRGYFKDNSGDASRFGMCEVCSDPTQTTHESGATSESLCNIPKCDRGQYIDGSSCSDCPADKYSNVELPDLDTQCVDCSGECEMCLYGTNKTGASDISECKLYCGPGEELREDECVPCARGFYKDNGDDESKFDLCITCTDNTKTTEGTGSISNDDCDIPKCDRGQYIIVGSTCFDCPVDKYSNVELPDLDTQCVDCSGECETCLYGTNSTGASDISECILYCPAGEELIDGTCTPCDRGYYKDNSDDDSRFGMCVVCSNSAFTTDSTGAISQALCTVPRCAAGEIIVTGDCEDCALDSYQPDVTPPTSTTCTACEPLGDISTGTRMTGSNSSSDCLPICEGGKQYDSTTGCTDCPMGFYKEASNRFDSCTACNSSYTTSGVGSMSEADCDIRDCQPGTFINATDDCEPCPVGQYQDQPRQTSCKECGPQLSTSGTGADSFVSCQIFCDPGNQGISDNGAGKICTSCPEHFFKAVAGLDPCEECAPNYTSNEERTACPDLFCYFGYEYLTDDNGVASCQMCEEGFYKATKGNQDPCVECEPGWTTDGTGQSECSVRHCVPGSYLDSTIGNCTLCERGTYKPDAGNQACTSCPSNATTLDMGATTNTKCDISICPIGKFRDAPDKGCSSCPLNTYQDEVGQLSCNDCATGDITLAMESTASSDCVPECQKGEEYQSSSKTCTPCPDGSYKDTVGNGDACTECPPDKTTLGSGSVSFDNCSQTVCPAGRYGDASTGTVACLPCAVGTYSDEIGLRTCKSCGSTFTTLRDESYNINDCVEECEDGNGYNEASSSCQQCDQGFYNDLSGREPNKCKVCPPGLTNLKSGSDNCTIEATPARATGFVDVSVDLTYSVNIDDCGTVIDLIINEITNNDRAHFYMVQQDQFPQSTICSNMDCENILFEYVAESCESRNVRKRAVNHDLKVLVTFRNVSEVLRDVTDRLYSFDDILSRILTTDRPELSSVDNEILLESFDTPISVPVCFAGERFINDTCEPCPIGTYSAGGVCTPCGANTYQDLTGQTFCTLCPENTANLNVGSISINDCEPVCQLGEVFVSSSKTCTPCLDGTYKDTVGNGVTCTNCPDNTTTIGTGSTSVNDCSQPVCQPGTYKVTTSGSVVCTRCAAGTYSSVAGQTICTSCAPTSTTLSDGSNSVGDCVAQCTAGNGYVDIESSGTCQPCPPGKFNDLGGDEPYLCKLCPTGSTNLIAGQSECQNTVPSPPVTTGLTIVRVVLQVQISVQNCNTGLDVILVSFGNNFRGHFRQINQNQFSRSTICRNAACDNVVLAILSDSCRTLGRKKRAVNHEVDLEATFTNVSESLIDNTGAKYEFNDILGRVLSTDKAELSPSPGTIELTTFQQPTATPVCTAGQGVNSSGVCDQCPAGMYGSDGTCRMCPADTYQNFIGQTSCQDCPDNTFRDGEGATADTLCLSYCTQTPLYCNNRGTCFVTGRRTARCECFDDYNGDTCLGKNEPSSNMPIILGAAIGGGGALLVILLIVVGVYRYLSNKEKISKKKRYSPDNDEFVSPVYDRHAYDNYTLTAGSNMPRPVAPYPSIGYPALGYRPDTSHDDMGGYASVYRNRPAPPDEDTFVWQA